MGIQPTRFSMHLTISSKSIAGSIAEKRNCFHFSIGNFVRLSFFDGKLFTPLNSGIDMKSPELLNLLP